MPNYKINHECLPCILNKYLSKYPTNSTEQEKIDYMKGVMKIISKCDNSTSAPEIVGLITEYKNSIFGFTDDFSDVKTYFNKLMLQNEDYYLNKIDSLKTALKFAMLGNYIDFGALDSVDESKLLNIPKDAENLNINEKEFKNLLQELKTSKNLVYLTDNCGEIVLDKLFIKKIKSTYPSLNITVIVKGGPVLNDATMEDAISIGLDKITNVIHNGCNIAGTPLNKISTSSKAIIDIADTIISKGQANFETLNGCNKNIYYLFLCKCSFFCKKFNLSQFTGLLLNERRTEIN